MNYLRIYDALISRAKDRELSGYSERHHIIPRCMGGTDDAANIVRLTAEEHFVAHELLVKAYPHVRGLVYAMLAMTMNKCDTRPTNKAFGWIRRAIAKAISDSKTGIPRDDETKAKISASKVGRAPTATALKNQRAGIASSFKGKPKSPEHIAALKIARNLRTDKPMQGRTHSEETKQKMREKATGRKMSHEAVMKMVHNKTPEQRRAGALKAWETKRAKAALVEDKD